MQFTIRPATLDDQDSLIEAVIEAEKSGTEIISYCNIFGLSRNELEQLLRDILNEDFGGQELCIQGFLIAETDGRFAAAANAWIECEDETPSRIIKANLLHHFLGNDRLQEARKHFAILAGLNFEREPGAIQLESIYVRPEFRGLGLTQRLLNEHISILRRRQPLISKAQIILTADNRLALRAYQKLGFDIVDTRTVLATELGDLLPHNCKYLMAKQFAPT